TANPTRSMLAAWGLTRAVTASMVGASAWAFLRTGRTLTSTNFATFTTSLAADAKACSMLFSNALMFFSFSPVDRRGCGCAQIRHEDRTRYRGRGHRADREGTR